MTSTPKDPESCQRTMPSSTDSKNKPVVIGLYGLPGCGKTTLLDNLKEERGTVDYQYYEGSEMISRCTQGGLEEFKKLSDDRKYDIREKAIKTIRQECEQSQKAGIVTGHFMFWSDSHEHQQVITRMDLEVYTHILYVNTPGEVIAHRCEHDKKHRNMPSVEDIKTWQNCEKDRLRQIFLDNCILFAVLSGGLALNAEAANSVKKLGNLIYDLRNETPFINIGRAKFNLTSNLSEFPAKKLIFLDADKTLTEKDTSILFWDTICDHILSDGNESPLKAIFQSLGYTFTAFSQAMLLCEEKFDDHSFDRACEKIAMEVTIHPEFLSFMQIAVEQQGFRVVILTSGIRRIWKKILEKAGLFEHVKLVGGGRLEDRCIVTPEVKKELVVHVQNRCKANVWAFGDSPLDIPMLLAADSAFVVSGPQETRSQSMEAKLLNAMGQNGLKPRQVLIPSTAPPRLNKSVCPIVRLTDPVFVRSIFGENIHPLGLHISHATNRAATKLLMTPMRDATVAGVALREAHRRVGFYLANEFVADIVGLGQHVSYHVQGHDTVGYSLLHEDRTTIVALMRGGEPMALGVNDAFPLASFLHAKDVDDLKDHHLDGQFTVILVDSVVNQGKTILAFIEKVRSLNATIRIVVVAGVVQEQVVLGSEISNALSRFSRANLVALRPSKNRFTGRGQTDTGNRLFNTTSLT